MGSRKLYRSRDEHMISGVAGGTAEYFDADPTLVRLIWLVLVFVPPSIGLIAYIVGWIVMPKRYDEIAPVQHAAPIPHG